MSNLPEPVREAIKAVADQAAIELHNLGFAAVHIQDDPIDAAMDKTP